jgi:hypothetical protein
MVPTGLLGDPLSRLASGALRRDRGGCPSPRCCREGADLSLVASGATIHARPGAGCNVWRVGAIFREPPWLDPVVAAMVVCCLRV